MTKWLNLEDIKPIFNRWADKTFGNRPLKSETIHLLREIEEYMEEKAAEELVDCWFIAIFIVHRIERIAKESNVNLVDEAHKKFETLKKREWLPPDAEGVIEHKRANAIVRWEDG